MQGYPRGQVSDWGVHGCTGVWGQVPTPSQFPSPSPVSPLSRCRVAKTLARGCEKPAKGISGCKSGITGAGHGAGRGTSRRWPWRCPCPDGALAARPSPATSRNGCTCVRLPRASRGHAAPCRATLRCATPPCAAPRRAVPRRYCATARRAGLRPAAPLLRAVPRRVASSRTARRRAVPAKRAARAPGRPGAARVRGGGGAESGGRNVPSGAWASASPGRCHYLERTFLRRRPRQRLRPPRPPRPPRSCHRRARRGCAGACERASERASAACARRGCTLCSALGLLVVTARGGGVSECERASVSVQE